MYRNVYENTHNSSVKWRQPRARQIQIVSQYKHSPLVQILQNEWILNNKLAASKQRHNVGWQFRELNA